MNPPTRFLPVLVALLLAACGGSPVVDGGTTDGSSNRPLVQILEPDTGSSVVASSGSVTVSIVVLHFTLSDGSSCGATDEACGQARINVDGSACNTNGQPYAAQGASTSFTINLGSCTTGRIAGSHTFTATLVDGSGNAIAGATSSNTATVTLN